MTQSYLMVVSFTWFKRLIHKNVRKKPRLTNSDENCIQVWIQARAHPVSAPSKKKVRERKSVFIKRVHLPIW